MAPVSNDVSRIRVNGWRQGSILPNVLITRLRKEKLLADAAENDLFLVLSHDCDVANDNLVAEPNCEILRLRPVPSERKDGNAFWGKSPRKYQFCDNSSGVDLCFEASIHDTTAISRTYLTETMPDGARSIAHANVRGICRWISRRYVRASFPDAFNERTRQAVNNFRRALKRRGELLECLFVLLSPSDDELDPHEDYNLTVWAAMRDEAYDFPQVRIEAQKLVNELEAHLASCEGIVVSEVELRSESQISLSDIRMLKRWDFDDLSLRDGPDASLPPAD